MNLVLPPRPDSTPATRGKQAPAPARKRLLVLGRGLPERTPLDLRPDHEQASPAWIRRALESSQRLPAGGWYAVDASHAIGPTPRAYDVNGRALVLWRDRRGLHAAPEACPHLGASLAGACVRDGALICPWHGLALGARGHGGWRQLNVHDDGTLGWVQLSGEDGTEAGTAAPRLPSRPPSALVAVIRRQAACEPRDVIQNRLDPWHGAHFHPHAFGRLRVIEQQEDAITVRVAFKLLGPLAVEVDARFACPDPRTIVMTIVRGEGEGSLVETHATPIRPGRSAILEATFATSERRGFAIARRLAPLFRPLIKRAAGRLWTEDAAYAERLYALRSRAGEAPA